MLGACRGWRHGEPESGANDGSYRLWVASRSGGWRSASGHSPGSAAAWSDQGPASRGKTCAARDLGPATSAVRR